MHPITLLLTLLLPLTALAQTPHPNDVGLHIWRHHRALPSNFGQNPLEILPNGEVVYNKTFPTPPVYNYVPLPLLIFFYS